MVDEALDLTFLEEIWVMLLEAVKRGAPSQLLGSNHDNRTLGEGRVTWSPRLVSGNHRNKQRDPMSSLVLAQKSCPTFHF